jgi:small subunit ribosomal protein S6
MRNRRYEAVFILPADLDEGKKKELLDRLDGAVEKSGGFLIKREDWGVRRLAYSVRNHPKGHYFLFDFVGSSQVVSELERYMRMFESVLRFLTVKTDDRVDLAAARKEQADEREKAAARAAAPPPTAPPRTEEADAGGKAPPPEEEEAGKAPEPETDRGDSFEEEDRDE